MKIGNQVAYLANPGKNTAHMFWNFHEHCVPLDRGTAPYAWVDWPGPEGARMYAALKFAVIVGLGWVVVASIPDLARYLKMRSI